MQTYGSSSVSAGELTYIRNVACGNKERVNCRSAVDVGVRRSDIRPSNCLKRIYGSEIIASPVLWLENASEISTGVSRSLECLSCPG